ncbi:MAG: AI-2E family transporter [Armatimonadetes bacterium]|nr:AI-2E family transporter [Armatimonadota bacterium]
MEHEKRPVQPVDLTAWSAAKVVLVLIGFWLLWLLRNILLTCFITLILVAAMEPFVVWLEKRKWSRVFSAAVVVLGLIFVVMLTTALAAKPMYDQGHTFVKAQLPEIVDRVTLWYQNMAKDTNAPIDVKQVSQSISQQLQQAGQQALGLLVNAASGLMTGVTILMLVFYLLVEGDALYRALMKLVPFERRAQVAGSLERSAEKLGAWLRGQFILCAAIGGLTFLGMWIIGVPAPLALGVIAGVFEIIPMLGPLLTAVVTCLMAAVSPINPGFKVALVLGFSIGLQMLENQILVPKVMEHAVGLSPVLVILALLVGGELAGIAGAILAVPVVAVLQVVIEDWPRAPVEDAVAEPLTG